MQGIHHFKNMPHYRLEGVPGKRRWHYLGPDEKKATDSHHFFAIEEALKQITPQHILDGFQVLGSGFNGTVLAFESPLGPLVVKNAYPAQKKIFGKSITEDAFYQLNDKLLHGLGMEMPELDEFVQRSKAILGAAALPTVYTAWDLGEIDQKLNELEKSKPLIEGLPPEKRKEGISTARQFLVNAWEDKGIAPVQISLRVGDVPGFQFTEAKGPAVKNIKKENAKQEIAEAFVGAGDRHSQNYLKIADSKGRALSVGVDYAWMSPLSKFSPPSSHWLHPDGWNDYKEAKEGDSRGRGVLEMRAKRFWEWLGLDKEGAAPEIARRFPYLEKVLRTSPQTLGIRKNPGLEQWFDFLRATAPRWAPNLDWRKI